MLQNPLIIKMKTTCKLSMQHSQDLNQLVAVYQIVSYQIYFLNLINKDSFYAK